MNSKKLVRSPDEKKFNQPQLTRVFSSSGEILDGSKLSRNLKIRVSVIDVFDEIEVSTKLIFFRGWHFLKPTSTPKTSFLFDQKLFVGVEK